MFLQNYGVNTGPNVLKVIGQFRCLAKTTTGASWPPFALPCPVLAGLGQWVKLQTPLKTVGSLWRSLWWRAVTKPAAERTCGTHTHTHTHTDDITGTCSPVGSSARFSANCFSAAAGFARTGWMVSGPRLPIMSQSTNRAARTSR